MPQRFLAAFTALLVLGACVPPEKVEDLGKRWEAATVMGEIQERGTLRYALVADSPTRIDGSPGAFDDFAADFATFLADVLGVDAEPVEVPAAQLATGLEAQDIDVAFPPTPVTEKAVRQQGFGDPLLVTHQRLLVPGGSSVGQATDLTGETVCSIADAETGLDLSTGAEATVRTERDPEVCAGGLADGTFAAVTAQDIVLHSIAAGAEDICATTSCASSSFEIVGDHLATGGLAPQLIPGAAAWSDYVSQVLDKWIEEGGWLASYTEHFGDTLTAEPEPPDLTIEEAAALYPR